MVTLTTGMLIVLLIAAGITAMAMLSVFASVIEHETQLHDLRNRVRELHYQRAIYMARYRGQIGDSSEEGEIEILDDDPLEPHDAQDPQAPIVGVEVEPLQAQAA